MLIGLNGVFECIFKTEMTCIRLVREKLTVFPHGQYINGIKCRYEK